MIYGSATGLQLASAQFFGEAELDTSLPGRAEGARLATSLARGDWNGDGVDDLAVGSPHSGFQTAGVIDSGTVYIAFGGVGGLGGTGAGGRIFSPDTFCDGDGGEQMGTSLAAGHLANGNRDGLLSSGATCTVAGVAEAGSVFFSNPGNADPTRLYVQTQFSTAGNGPNDHFGLSLAVADFNADGLDDLATGAPNKNHGAGNPSDSGRVYVAYSTAGGPDPANGADLIGEDEWAGQTPAANEHFGTALAAGKVTRDAFADLLMGAPGEGANGGFLFLKKGSATGLTTDGNQVISQGFLGGTTEAGDLFGSVLALGDVNG
ncbi:MAG TPA: FG-GAP repeat protein, partial [Thermoanaerobaculia bacterium]|nr:FG-GAP repeat protein [Thermoanaerobaculia bacterium]